MSASCIHLLHELCVHYQDKVTGFIGSFVQEEHVLIASSKQAQMLVHSSESATYFAAS